MSASVALVPCELTSLTQRLATKKRDCQRLRDQTRAVEAERDAARTACTAGVAAAKAQMVRLRAELEAARRVAASVATAASAAGAGGGGASGGQADTAAADRRGAQQALELRARGLRHEVARWRHQAGTLTGERPRQEAEVARLKAELVHARDVLESTRGAASHREAASASPPGAAPAVALASPGLIGGHGGAEAYAERTLRERTEERNAAFAGKTQRLTRVVAAQQQLIQRLEKQLAKETGLSEQQGLQLEGEARRHAQLKGVLRRRSDDAVSKAMGVPAAVAGAQASPGKHSRPTSSPSSPGRCPGAGPGAAPAVAA